MKLLETSNVLAPVRGRIIKWEEPMLAIPEYDERTLCEDKMYKQSIELKIERWEDEGGSIAS